MPTPLLGFPEIMENQSGKYITHNVALALLEAVTTRIISRSNNGAPSNPSNGDTYIVDDNSGDWSNGSIDDIAHYLDGKWRFITPIEGLLIWCVDESQRIYYTGSLWRSEQAPALNTINEYNIGNVSGEVEIDWNNGIYQAATLEGGTTFTFSNIFEGRRQIRLTQDSVGGRIPVFPSGEWQGGDTSAADIVSTGDDDESIVKIFNNGIKYYYEVVNYQK